MNMQVIWEVVQIYIGRNAGRRIGYARSRQSTCLGASIRMATNVQSQCGNGSSHLRLNISIEVVGVYLGIGCHAAGGRIDQSTSADRSGTVCGVVRRTAIFHQGPSASGREV